MFLASVPIALGGAIGPDAFGGLAEIGMRNTGGDQNGWALVWSFDLLPEVCARLS